MEPDEGANTRLAVYGSLAPDQANHAQLVSLAGRWRAGTVRGRLNPRGWAAAQGYPGLVLDPTGPEVEVHLFESLELPAHWGRLDAFEGTRYRRVIAAVRTTEGNALAAWIYVLADPPSRDEL